MNVTPIDKAVATRLESLNVNASGQLVADFSVGIVSEDGAYRGIANKPYVLQPEEAAPILATETVEGEPVFDQLANALVAHLSQRADWIA